MQTVVSKSARTSEVLSSLDLQLLVSDPNILTYLVQFETEEIRAEKALEALKVGVIAIQSASPTLDTRVVQSKFAEVESRLREQMAEFQKKASEDLVRYFAEHEGVVPRSIAGALGESGTLARTFSTYFDPAEGRLARLMQAQIGPQSNFGKALDPTNKQGILCIIEAKVQELVEAKLDEVLGEFSLDADDSAMTKLHKMLTEQFQQLNRSLGIQTAIAVEAQRGHVKGFVFEDDLYSVFAGLGANLGDDTEQVGGIVGTISRCKKGDYVATLGNESGAPGVRVVVEVKDQSLRLKDAIDELQEAKKNRESASGIFVFARGMEPPEVGDFRRIGEDFFVTVDKEELTAGRPLTYLETAYKIARAMAVGAVRKETAGQINLQAIQDQLSALAAWSDRIADISTKAKTIQSSGKMIEQCIVEFKTDLDTRLNWVLQTLKQGA